MNSNTYYKNLKLVDLSLSSAFNLKKSAMAVPKDWSLFTFDIEGSTKLIKQGKSKLVNTIAIEFLDKIVGILNTKDISVPVFWGGDGATVAMPSNQTLAVTKSLSLLQKSFVRRYSVFVRLAEYKVKYLEKKDMKIKLAKVTFGNSPQYAIAFGNALNYVEKNIRRRRQYVLEEFESVVENQKTREVNWIKLPLYKCGEEILCYFIKNKNIRTNLNFSEILFLISKVYGEYFKLIPPLVSPLAASKQQTSIIKKIFNIVMTGRAAASIIHKNNAIINNLEVIKFDGKVLSGCICASREEHDRLIKLINSHENLKISYSLSPHAVISTSLINNGNRHYFIDGFPAGFNRAAKNFLQK